MKTYTVPLFLTVAIFQGWTSPIAFLHRASKSTVWASAFSASIFMHCLEQKTHNFHQIKILYASQNMPFLNQASNIMNCLECFFPLGRKQTKKKSNVQVQCIWFGQVEIIVYLPKLVQPCTMSSPSRRRSKQ